MCEAKKRKNKKSVQILGYKTEHLQANDLIGMASNFGDLISHLGHVDALSLFEDWLRETSDLRDVLSIRFAVISEQSSFGR